MVLAPIEIFISHSAKDKKIARKLADELNNYAINTFVAHDDIEVGENWEKTLVGKIKECDLFIALLSKNFHTSQYTDQEVGIAHVIGKPIFPVRIDETIPYGFMSKLQAKKVSAEIDKDEITKLFFTMASKSEVGTVMINNLIEEFCESNSFKNANNTCSLLSQCSSFSDEQINRIAKGFVDNDQIRGGWKAEPWCIKLIKDNWKKIDKKLAKEIRSLTEN